MSANRLAVWGLAAAALLMLACGAIQTNRASAHAGHDHHDGRLPGQPDFKRIGNTTYRFKPGLEQYEIRTPGEPPATAHVDYKVGGVFAGPNTPLPTQELAPICRTSGNRIVVVYSHRSSDTTPTPTEALRSIVRRMNWKINQQGSVSSGGGRTVQMAVDCTSGGAIQVYDVTTSDNDLSTVASAVQGQLVGSPTGEKAVKYLVFDNEANASAAGISETHRDASKAFGNQNASITTTSIAYSGVWTNHVPMHELFHGLGSAQGEVVPAAPYSTFGYHCVDGLDILCYDDGTASTQGEFTDTRCRASEGYDQADKTPIDCKYDTYFSTAPAPGTWLANYWNSGGEEDPFLVNGSDPLLMVGGGSTSGLRVGEVTLRGTVYARGGLDTTYRFEYGTTTSYGSSAPVPSAAVAATPAGKAVETTVTGLTANTTYHYRLAAANSKGTISGQDRTFKTSIWTIQPTHPPSVGREFLDVSCTARTACTAVGGTTDLETATMVERWDGREWTDQTTPDLPGTEFDMLQSVSCGGPSSCMAVGSSRVEYADDPSALAEIWNGSGWSVTAIPTPTGATGRSNLYGVSCPSSNWCVAVGEYGTVPNPEEEVGYEEEPREETRALIAVWDGSAWTLMPSPRPEGVDGYSLRGVSCASVAACSAVGRIESETGVFGVASLVERWDGEAWSFPTAVLHYDGASWLDDVSCASVNDCMAVGTKNGGGKRLSEHWDGSSWTEKVMAGESAGPTSISCLPSGSCVAVGDGLGLTAASWGGESWSFDAMGSPVGFGELALGGVSCAAAQTCVAVGQYGSSGLAEHSNPVVAPTVTTVAATAVMPTSATLNATVNPEGYATQYQLEYGTTTGYGSKAPVSAKAIGSGVNEIQLSEAISGLQQGTTYHFRVVASSAAGKAVGKDLTVVTALGAPKLTRMVGSEGSGDGQFSFPRDVAFDSGGNTWVADTLNHKVKKFNGNGEYVSKFGSWGSSPEALAFDGNGDIWVLRPYAHRVQEFDQQGKELTGFGAYGSGNGQLGSGATDVTIDPDGAIWVVDAGNHRLQKFNQKGEFVSQFGSYGSGNGQFSRPTELAFDATGNIWVVDSNNNRIQKFNKNGEYLTQVGAKGSGGGMFMHPEGIAIDPDGGIWVADTGNDRIERFGESGNYLGQIGSEGPLAGQLQEPMGVAFDNQGDLWIVDTENHRLQEWAIVYPPNAPLASTEAATGVGPGGATLRGTVSPERFDTRFYFEYGTTTSYGSQAPVAAEGVGAGASSVAVSKQVGGLKAGTEYHCRVVAVGPGGTVKGGDAQFTTLQLPPSVSSEEVETYPTMHGASLYSKVNPNGYASTYQVEYGTTTAYGVKVPTSPTAVTLTPNESYIGTEEIYVGESLSDLTPGTTYHFRVVVTNKNGTTYGNDREFKTRNTEGPEFEFDIGEYGEGEGQFQSPAAIATDRFNDLFVADTGGGRIQMFNSDGEYQMQIGSPGSGPGELDSPMGVAVDPYGNIWVSDTGNNRVQEFDPSGQVIDEIGAGAFDHPTGLAIDLEGDIWIVDTGHDWIVEYRPTGFYVGVYGSTGSGNGQFSNPTGIVVDHDEGHVWVADTGNLRVQELARNGAYLSQFGSEGSGAGELMGLAGIALGIYGDLWVADPSACRVQQFNLTGEYVQQFGECGAGEGQMGNILEGSGLAISPEGEIWVADGGNNRIEKWSGP